MYSSVRLIKEDFDKLEWQCLIEQSEEKTCFSYSKSFRHELEKARKQKSKMKITLYTLLRDITSLMLDIDNPYQPFKPFAVFQNSRSAVIDDIDENHLEIFKEVIHDIIDPEMTARVADVLWFRKKDYQMGQIAVRAYCKSFRSLYDPENWSESAKRIERALQLSAMLGKKKQLYKETIEIIKEILDRLNGEDPSFLSHKLMNLLLEQKQGDSKKYISFSKKLAQKAEKEEEYRKARFYWECKGRWHALDKNRDGNRDSLIASSETYIKQAFKELDKSEPSSMVVASLLQNAIEGLKKIEGTNERIEELHKQLKYYQEKSVSEMQQFNSMEIDIADIISDVNNKFDGKNLSESLIILAQLASSTGKKILKNKTEESTEKTSLSNFFSTIIIDEKGRTRAKHDSKGLNDQKENATQEMYQIAITFRQLISEALILPARTRILLEHDIEQQDFMFLIHDNTFVPQGREHVFVQGLYSGLKGDLVTSTHLLIPQLENSIRHILMERGVLTTTIDTEGIQKERDLNTLLIETELKNILGEDLTFDLQGLLVKRAGSNLRNRMAHGLMDGNEFTSTEALYLWWLVLRICYLFRVELLTVKREGNSKEEKGASD